MLINTIFFFASHLHARSVPSSSFSRSSSQSQSQSARGIAFDDSDDDDDEVTLICIQKSFDLSTWFVAFYCLPLVFSTRHSTTPSKVRVAATEDSHHCWGCDTCFNQITCKSRVSIEMLLTPKCIDAGFFCLVVETPLALIGGLETMWVVQSSTSWVQPLSYNIIIWCSENKWSSFQPKTSCLCVWVYRLCVSIPVTTFTLHLELRKNLLQNVTFMHGQGRFEQWVYKGGGSNQSWR